MPIRTIAEKCADEFQARVSSYTGNEFTEDLEGERQLVETQNARFNLWANSIGKSTELQAELLSKLTVESRCVCGWRCISGCASRRT